MFGQHVRPERYHALVDVKPDARVMKMLQDVRQVIARATSRMPTHEQYIEKFCKAPEMSM
jgi:tryptophan halogenase